MVGRSPRVRAALLVIVAVAACVASAAAQSWEPARLRRVIEERYRVFPVQDGVMLVPRQESGAIKSIEVRGDAVAIDGAVVTGAELRDRLKSDSDAILALSYLEPAARRALFERTSAAPKPAEPQAAEPPAAEPEAGGREPEEPAQAPVRTHRLRRNDARVHIGGSVNVDENETVDGPVVAIGGSVSVNGDVREDVVAVGGNVRLGPKARVRGDVTTVGGTIERDPGAVVDGNMNQIGFTLHDLHLGGIWFPAAGFVSFRPWVQLVASLFRMMLFALLAALAFLVASRPVARIEQAAAIDPWKAGLVGLLTELLFVPVFVLTCICLAVSLIGIPLLILFVPAAIAALFVAFVIGFAGVASRIGHWAQQRFGWRGRSPFLLLLIGLLCVWSLTIVGRVIGLAGWPIWFLSAALLLTGFLVEYVAWTVGLGAAVMTRFGTRPPAGGGLVPPAAAAVSPGPQS